MFIYNPSKTLNFKIYFIFYIFPQSERELSLIIKVRADDSDDKYCSEYEEWQPGLDSRPTAHIFTWRESNISIKV